MTSAVIVQGSTEPDTLQVKVVPVRQGKKTYYSWRAWSRHMQVIVGLFLTAEEAEADAEAFLARGGTVH